MPLGAFKSYILSFFLPEVFLFSMRVKILILILFSLILLRSPFLSSFPLSANQKIQTSCCAYTTTREACSCSSRAVSHKTAHWFMFCKYLTIGLQHLFLTPPSYDSVFNGFKFCKASILWAEVFLKTGHKWTHFFIHCLLNVSVKTK